MVYALVGGAWRPYEHHDTEDVARRQAAKINRRILEAEARDHG